MALLQELDVPFSLIGHTRHNEGINFVDVDFRQTVLRGVEYLANLGHQRLLFLNFAASALADGYGPAVRTQAAFEEGLALLSYTVPGMLAHPTRWPVMNSRFASWPAATRALPS